MAAKNNKTRFQWRGQSTFVVISVGATLSLKDFLTFPVMAGENGGGAFLLFYIFFLAVMGLPLLMSEIMLGRMTGSNFVHAMGALVNEYKVSPIWWVIAVLALIAGFLILSSYSAVSGWSLAYFFKTGLGVYQGATVDGVQALFGRFQADPEAMMLWHTLFVAIASQPLKQGLERVFIIIVPAMAILLVIGILYSAYSSGILESIEYILYPDWSRVDSSTPLLALQRAFFTLALGLGIMVIFGAYLDQDTPVAYVAGQIIMIDLLFSIFTGLAINALVFSVDLQPLLDDELAFRFLPAMFGSLEFGHLFGALFYLLLTLAAVTTAVAILEAVLSYYQLKFDQSRVKAAIQLGLALWVLGLGTIFSYGLWQDSGFTMTINFGEEAYRVVNQAGLHDIIIYLSSHLVQPLVALAVTLFVAWVIPRSVSFEALNLPNRKLFEVWNFLIRYITPVLVLIVLLSTLGVINT